MTRRTLSFREEEAIRRAGRVQVALRKEDGGRVFTIDNASVARFNARHPDADDLQLIDLIRTGIEEGAIERGFRQPDKFLPEIVMRTTRNIRQILAREMQRN